MLSSSVGMMFAQAIFPEQNSKGKYGYVDASGYKVIDYKYDEATAVNSYGIASVMKGGKWGLVSEDGRQILNTSYSEIGQFINGMARVAQNDKYGYVNTEGQIVIPVKYSFIGTPNEDGLIWVADGKKLESAKFGLYKWDKLIIKPENTKLGVFAETDGVDLTNGQSFNLTTANQIKSNFSKLPKNQSIYYWVVKNGKTGLVDDNGVYVLKPDTYFVAMPKEGIAAIAKVSGGNFNCNYVFLNDKERRLFSTDKIGSTSADMNLLPYLGQFNNGLAMNRVDGEYYIIDTTGRIVSDRYSELIMIADKGYLVKYNGMWGTTDLSGKYLVKPTYSYINNRSDEECIFAAQKEAGGKCGYIDYTGNEVIPFMYDDAGIFLRGRGYVKTSKGWGVIDKNNKNIIAPQWDNIVNAVNKDDKLIWVRDSKDSKWHCRNLSNDTSAFDATFDAAGCFTDYNGRYASLVGVGSMYGIVDETGSMIIPLAFEDKNEAANAMAYIQSIGAAKMGEFEAFRYRLRQNKKCNSTLLKEKIDEELWDF